jgi:hypothetical protein
VDPRPQVVDLAPLLVAERSDRNRQVAGDTAGVAVTLFAGVGVFFRSPLFTEWIRVAFLTAFIALAALFVYQLVQALVRRPIGLGISGQGIRLLFAVGPTRDLSWTEVANEVRIEEVTVHAPKPGVRSGSRLRVAKPIPHSFRAPNPGLETIRAAAGAAGLTEEVRTLTRVGASGWAPLGIRVRFRFAGVPASP